MDKTTEVKSNIYPKKLAWTWSWWQLKLVIAGVLLYYLFSSGKLSLTILYASLSWSSLIKIIMAGFLFLLAYLFCSWRIFLLFKAQDSPFSFKLCLQINLIGFFFNNFLPATIGGDTMRAYYFTKGKRKQLAPVLATLFYDRLLGLLALILMAFTGLGLAWFYDQSFVWTKEFKAGFVVLASAMSIIFIIYGLARWQHFMALIEMYLARIPMGKAISHFVQSIADLSKYGLLTLALLVISLGPHISCALALYFTGQAFGLESSFWLTIILSPLIFLSGILPLSPNNIGWTEYWGSLIWATQGIGQGGDLWMAYRLIYVLVSLTGLVVYLRLRAGALPHES